MVGWRGRGLEMLGFFAGGGVMGLVGCGADQHTIWVHLLGD